MLHKRSQLEHSEFLFFDADQLFLFSSNNGIRVDWQSRQSATVTPFSSLYSKQDLSGLKQTIHSVCLNEKKGRTGQWSVDAIHPDQATEISAVLWCRWVTAKEVSFTLRLLGFDMSTFCLATFMNPTVPCQPEWMGYVFLSTFSALTSIVLIETNDLVGYEGSNVRDTQPYKRGMMQLPRSR